VARFGVRRPVTRLGLLLEVPAHGREDPGLFERMVALAETAENAGFDSLWVSDRTAEPLGGQDDSSGLEAYSLLGGLATRTRRIRLGALPRGEDRRAPSMLAKIITGIDVISHGRSVATLGSGSGRGNPPVDRLTEGLRVCRAVLDEGEIEFSGTFYDIHGALNRPRPLQVGGVPLALMVEDGYPLRSEVLTAAVRYVDAVIIGGDTTAVNDVVEVVRAASLLHDIPADSVQVIWMAGSPSSDSEVGVETDHLEGLLAAGADGCILSIGTDAPSESIRQGALQLSAAMESSSGHS
jgi:alkanesulfonate monooxygenase SsuD/methylene tetrahydromethanopterin reductase-like flavin-dependent oxidoreductase (luciferase family)